MPGAQGVGRSNRPAPTKEFTGSIDKINELGEARAPPESATHLAAAGTRRREFCNFSRIVRVVSLTDARRNREWRVTGNFCRILGWLRNTMDEQLASTAKFGSLTS
jgi:hypothetical protein